MNYTTGCAVTSGALIPVGPFKCIEGFFTGCFVSIHALEFDQAIRVPFRLNVLFHLAYHPLNDVPIVSNAMSHKADWLSIVYSHLFLFWIACAVNAIVSLPLKSYFYYTSYRFCVSRHFIL